MKKPATSHVEAGGADEHLGVAGPAQPLVALRAIGGHFQEIALLAPEDIVLQLVEHRVGALKRCRSGGVSECTTIPVIASASRRAGKAAHLDVAEAVEGEARLVGSSPPSRE